MHKIIASIITYNPEINRLQKNIESIVNQVNGIVIVDNGSSNIQDIKNLVTNIKKAIDYSNIEFIINEENVGIATALNQSLNYSKDNNYKWLLTLDQDSICEKDMIYNMNSLFETYVNDRTAIIAPNIIDENKASEIEPMMEEIEFPTVAITSGSLTNVDIALSVNGFDDKFFIDYVDHEFCLKLKKNNYDIIKYKKSKLYHQLGDIDSYKILGKTATVTNHSGIRRYYYFRNGIYVHKKYKKDFLDWIKIDSKRRRNVIIGIVLFEKDKLNKLKMCYRGIRDGLQMKFGKYEN